jgi:hypothetical protein
LHGVGPIEQIGRRGHRGRDIEDLPAANYHDRRPINRRGAPYAAYEQRLVEIIGKQGSGFDSHIVMSGALTKNRSYP